MRLKPIKPGMVIHFETDEEKKMLLEALEEQGYVWTGGAKPTTDSAFLYSTLHVYSSNKTIPYKHIALSNDNGNTKFSDLIIPELSAEEEAYNKGLNDAWELARKIVLREYDGGMSVKDFYNIFDKTMADEDVLKKFTPQEALAKIAAYEKEQAEIKAGDVVSHDGLKGVVTRVTDDCIYTICMMILVSVRRGLRG